jgi:hypothetical protein
METEPIASAPVEVLTPQPELAEPDQVPAGVPVEQTAREDEGEEQPPAA